MRLRYYILLPLIGMLATSNLSAQNNEYLEAAKQFRASANATKCTGRRQYFIDLAEYTECIGYFVRNGTPCNKVEPAKERYNLDCPEDQNNPYTPPAIENTTGATYARVGNAMVESLNPFMRELYKNYMGHYPTLQQLDGLESRWMSSTGIRASTMNALAASATSLYSALGHFDSETANRLNLTSAAGNLVSVAADLDYQQAENVQAIAQGIGLLWDMAEKSKAKRLHQAEMENQRRELERAQKEYETNLLQAKNEFIRGFAGKTFETNYSGSERKAIALWYPKDITIDIQPIYLSNLIDVQPYADGSFPLRENLYNTLSKQLPDSLRNNKAYAHALVYPIRDEAQYSEKLLAILKATENVHFTPREIRLNIQKTTSQTAETDFWGNPVKMDTTVKENKVKEKSFWEN